MGDADEELPPPRRAVRCAAGPPERLDLAVVPGSCGGTNIVAVSSDRRTVIYDAAAGAEVPCGRELRYCMTNGTTLIPLGTRLYAVATNLRPPTSVDSRPSFQALHPPPPLSSSSGSHGRWS